MRFGPLARSHSTMPRALIVLGIAILLAATVLAAQLFGARTELEIDRDKIEIAWTKVERDLARRVDLLPQWLHMVSGHPAASSRPCRLKLQRAKHALQGVASAASRPDVIEAHRRLEVEIAALQDDLQRDLSYRRNEEFLRVENQILAIENRIDLDRTEYNDAVQHFNTRLALFPGNLAANVFGLRRYGVYVPTDTRSASLATSFTEPAPETAATP